MGFRVTLGLLADPLLMVVLIHLFAPRRLTFEKRESKQSAFAPGWAPPSSVFLHSGDAPWARRHRPSMAGGGSRGIHAARPTPRRLRSACTQVAFCGVWTFAEKDQEQEQEQEQEQGRKR